MPADLPERKSSKPSPAKAALATPPATFARTIRETVESVVIAFVLAFMFRTFEAEAFVIPTGSMANTLKGRHKDIECPQCHLRYQANASDEVDNSTNALMDPRIYSVVSCLCPNCRYPEKAAETTPSYGGDRILVAKFPFEFFAQRTGEPKRWEVIVFKFPDDAKQNYIKRLVGLPGEDLKLHHGDVFISHDGGKSYAIERKPPRKVLAMGQIVYNNDYHSPQLDTVGWPQRWQAEPADTATAAWKSDDGSISFHTAGAAGVQSWLRYRHFVPTFDDWDAIAGGKMPATLPRPQLITDMYAYDAENVVWRTKQIGMRAPEPYALGLHWVGDLILECKLTVEQATGAAIFEIVKGGRKYQCRLDLEKKQAELTIDGGTVPFAGEDQAAAMKRTAPLSQLTGSGSYNVGFANVDEQLYLWINGTPIAFDGSTAFEGLIDDKPTKADLAPVGVCSEGAGLTINNLKISRDVYYIATKDNMLVDYSSGPIANMRIGRPQFLRDEGMELNRRIQEEFVRTTKLRAAFFSEPQGELDGEKWNWDRDFADLHTVHFATKKDEVNPQEDQFFMMGDNSPGSSDGRLWAGGHYVPRDLLIGKALFIYWPHSFDRIPGTGIPFPFFPNFARMGFVR
ncbi:MAG TPA: S26 family signal peptidase [Pirellulales bacterium]|jgi:signal peptidase I|nr:S26 family signal peptidase [Pirellulales bacterium]